MSVNNFRIVRSWDLDSLFLRFILFDFHILEKFLLMKAKPISTGAKSGEYVGMKQVFSSIVFKNSLVILLLCDGQLSISKITLL